MSTQTASHSRERGITIAHSGNGYVRSLIENHLDEYVRAFEVKEPLTEDVFDILATEVTILLNRLENDLITTS